MSFGLAIDYLLRFWTHISNTHVSWLDFQLRQCFQLFNAFFERDASLQLFGRQILHRTAFAEDRAWYVFFFAVSALYTRSGLHISFL